MPASRLVTLISSMMDEFHLSDQDFQYLHDGIDWHVADYETPDDLVDHLRSQIKAPGSANSRSIPERLAEFMKQEGVDDNRFLELHGRVPWHDTDDEDFAGILHELRTCLDRDRQRVRHQSSEPGF